MMTTGDELFTIYYLQIPFAKVFQEFCCEIFKKENQIINSRFSGVARANQAYATEPFWENS